MTEDELQAIEQRQSPNDVPMLVAEVRRLRAVALSDKTSREELWGMLTGWAGLLEPVITARAELRNATDRFSAATVAVAANGVDAWDVPPTVIQARVDARDAVMDAERALLAAVEAL